MQIWSEKLALTVCVDKDDLAWKSAPDGCVLPQSGGGALGNHSAQYTDFTNEKTVGCWSPTDLLYRSVLSSAKWVFGKKNFSFAS